MQHIVVTGGAGYIGSVVAQRLVAAGYNVTIIDHAPVEHLPAVLRGAVQYLSCDFADPAVALFFQSTLKKLSSVDAVIHLAAFIEVGESVVDPARYYENNLSKTITLLNYMRDADIPVIIAASSSAVYGSLTEQALREDDPCVPCSPYGRTKLMMEWVLRDYEAAYGTRSGILRFCNVAGAVPELGLGERHQPETHLIPRLIHAMVHEQPYYVYGTEYPTPDGSCIRDYVHVSDVAQIHLLLLRYLLSGGSSLTCSVGSGAGSSVCEVITAVNGALGKRTTPVIAAQRSGDPAYLVADITRARAVLGWEPKCSSLDTIVKSAVRFHFPRASSTCFTASKNIL